MWSYKRQYYGRLPTFSSSHVESSYKENLFQYFTNSVKDKLLFTDDVGGDIPPYTCDYCTAPVHANVCVVADEEGYVSLVDTHRNTRDVETPVKVVEKWQSHNNAVFDVAWIVNSNLFATASGDTTAVLWDATSPGKQLNIFCGHSCSLKSICISTQNPNLLATGSRDGNALIWDSRVCNAGVCSPVIRIQDAHAVNDVLTPQRKRRRKSVADRQNQLLNDSRQTVTSVIFQDSNTLVTSGAMDGTLKLWDLRKTHFVKQPSYGGGKSQKSGFYQSVASECIQYPGCSSRRRGYTCLAIDSTQTRLFASCTDNTVYEYNLSNAMSSESRNPTRMYTGHFSSSFYVRVKLSPDDCFLLSGSNDEKAYIWKTYDTADEVSPSYCLKSDGMDQVTSVSWCPSDWTQIVTCSDDCAVRVWRLPWSLSSKHVQQDGCCEKIQQPGKKQCKEETRQYSEENKNIPPSDSSNAAPSTLLSSQISINNRINNSSQKITQLSLNKWFSRQTESTEFRVKKCLDIEKIKEIIEVKKENHIKYLQNDNNSLIDNTNKFHANLLTSDEQNNESVLKPQKILSNCTNVSPGKVEFRSRKPKLRSRSTRSVTMEDYFLRKLANQ